jgi:hypothetical protein
MITMAHDHATTDTAEARPVAAGPTHFEDPAIHQLVMTFGATHEGLADGILALNRANDPAVWTGLQQLLGNAATVRVHQTVLARKPSPVEPASDPGAQVIATQAAAEHPNATTTAGQQTTTAAPDTKAADPDPTLLAPMERTIAGVRVVAPAGAHAEAIDRCATFIQQEVGKNELAQKKFREAKVTIVIIPAKVAMTDVAQFSKLKGQQTFDGRDWSTVRGSGGMTAPDGSFAIGVAEENLINVKGVLSDYPAGYSIGMHELAHTVHSQGMTKTQQEKVTKLYDAHAASDPGNAKGTWTDTYASANEREYFAQATNCFLGKNAMGTNHNGRAWLEANDPQMFAFLVDLYETAHDDHGKTKP